MWRLQLFGGVTFLALCALSLNSCNQTKVKPYNLVLSTDGADPNGLLLNPLWGDQFNGLQGNTPGPGPKPLPSPNEPWSPSQTDWDIGSDSGLFCSGHKNWHDSGGRLRAGTYTGLLTWESHSAPWPFNDDDYSFNLVPMSLTSGPVGAGLQANEDHIHVEYNVSEVGDRFDGGETPWWQAFHNAVDHSDATPTPFDMLTSRTAIVTGLLGMDTAHPPPMAGDSGGETEIHPIWAMAVRVRDNSSNNNGAADETWAFMARNWGDEGFCADGTQWTLSTDTLSILIPWRPGAQKIDGLSGEFSIVNAPDSNLQNNVSVTYAGTSGLLLTFKLKSPPDEPDEDGTVTEGELQIHWSGTLVNNPLASAPRQTSGEQETGPEGAMRRLVGKMTPQQRTGFLAATAVKRIPKPSYHSSLGPPVQVTALPVRPKNAPAIRHVPSKRRAQAEKSRMDALHAIFGATIPGVAENKPGTAR